MYCAILGCGVVGSGVAEILLHNADVIKEKSNVELKLKKILDIRDFPQSEISPYLTKSFDEIVNDDEIEMVVETMGGVKPAFDFVSSCLKAGKHVATSNKELVAKHGIELLEIARQKNVNFMFEAAVGGGIPIIRPIARCLAANRITEVAGILNGTTNFILNKMINDSMDFSDALALAQKNGYAEKDPTADIEGIDACRKICIMASLAFGAHVYPDEKVYTEGITKITLDDVKAADSIGYAIKLIAQTKLLDNGKIKILVSPAAVSKNTMLAGVHGVFNACLVRGDMVGEVLMYGPGAGKEATASAVVGDMIDMASHAKERKIFGWGEAKENYIESLDNLCSKFFVRTDDGAFITEEISEKDAKAKYADAKAVIRVFE